MYLTADAVILLADLITSAELVIIIQGHQVWVSVKQLHFYFHYSGEKNRQHCCLH